MNSYKILSKQIFSKDKYSIVPIRTEDRHLIMKWRNEQVYHLRQKQQLTRNEQDNYFTNTISKLFTEEEPEQILFSYLENNKCIGYGGLVHINWLDKNAEISFLMNTAYEKDSFSFHWKIFLDLIELVAFKHLDFHKIYTFAYDLRPQLYAVLEDCNYFKEARLKDHSLFNGNFIDVIIHAKINDQKLVKINEKDLELTYNWANNKTIRKYSFNKKQIKWEDHKNWFYKQLNNKNCYYYKLEINNKAVGLIRFDLENTKAKISYLVDPVYQGKGYGTLILEMGITKLVNENRNIDTVHGYVLKDNIASIKIFNKLNFNQITTPEKQILFEKTIINED